jgi:hypothetical protein
MSAKSSDSLDSKVRKWLEKQGYSLEMRAARSFEKAGFEVSQSEHYLDPETNTVRETDVVASLHRRISNTWLSVKFYIECKYAYKPWVVFTSPKRLDKFAYFSRILMGKYDVYRWQTYQTLQGRFLARILQALGGERIRELPVFSLSENVGYRVTESLRDDPGSKDSAYSALMQTISCIQAHDMSEQNQFVSMLEDYGSDYSEFSLSRERFSLFCGIGFPVILMRGKLFECWLDLNRAIALREVEESVVRATSKAYALDQERGSSISVVRIITERQLEAFSQGAFEAAEKLLSEIKAVEGVWEHEYHKIPPQLRSDEIPF